MRFLLLCLDGPMQAWGRHTYEDYRPVELFPTRSGLLGLLGACMGMKRSDKVLLQKLASSVYFAVRSVARNDQYKALRIMDFHTVQNARNVAGGEREFPVVTRREYLCDAVFYVAIGQASEGAFIQLEQIEAAVKKPVFTPFLGRRSCPLSRPLFAGWAEAADLVQALRMQLGGEVGLIYSELGEGEHVLRMRDVPIFERERQFATRTVHVYPGKEG